MGIASPLLSGLLLGLVSIGVGGLARLGSVVFGLLFGLALVPLDRFSSRWPRTGSGIYASAAYLGTVVWTIAALGQSCYLEHSLGINVHFAGFDSPLDIGPEWTQHPATLALWAGLLAVLPVAAVWAERSHATLLPRSVIAAIVSVGVFFAARAAGRYSDLVQGPVAFRVVEIAALSCGWLYPAILFSLRVRCHSPDSRNGDPNSP